MSDQLAALVALALHEDLEHGGDVTAVATVPEDLVGRALVVARSSGVVAGLETVAAVTDAIDPAIGVLPLLADGSSVQPGTAVVELQGNVRNLLLAERTLLNFLCHLSGVATLTARFVDALAGTRCVVRDTRKTTPGMRALEKAAVVAGGGANHRRGLYDGILIKDNHVAASGGVLEATRAAVAYVTASGRDLTVQVEVDDVEQLREALTAGATSILLDNFTVARLAAAVQVCREQREYVFVEASGGVTLENVREIALTGVDAVAIGALTHSAPVLDLGLDWPSEQFGGGA